MSTKKYTATCKITNLRVSDLVFASEFSPWHNVNTVHTQHNLKIINKNKPSHKHSNSSCNYDEKPVLLRWHPLWKHMRNLTHMDIEKSAVWELISYFEDRIEEVIKQSTKELQNQNKLRQDQGLYSKIRIDRNCICNAIKTINSDEYSSLPGKAGGKNQEGRNEKHSPIENVLHGGNIV